MAAENALVSLFSYANYGDFRGVYGFHSGKFVILVISYTNPHDKWLISINIIKDS